MKFRKLFYRGLAFVLPTILTIALLAWVYGFISQRIAEPINSGVRESIVRLLDYPPVDEQDIAAYEELVGPEQVDRWHKAGDYQKLRQLEARRARRFVWQIGELASSDGPKTVGQDLYANCTRTGVKRTKTL